MRWIKLSAFLSLWGFFFGLVAVVHFWITVLHLPDRWKIVSRLTRNYTLLLRQILNIRITTIGGDDQLERGGYVIISNHMSYVDGIVLGSVFPIVFVSKKEVRSWPVVGQWNRLCGTIFIDRQHKSRVANMVTEMAQRLKQGANILLFPEGTSTNGERMLPFQSVPLAAPLRCRSVIVPVTLAYRAIDDEPVSANNRDLIYWYGEMDFLTHFWRLLALRNVDVLVTIQPRIECFRYPDNSLGRKKLAKDCYDRVLGRVAAENLENDDEDNNEAEPRLLSS